MASLLKSSALLALILMTCLGGCLPQKQPSPRIDYYTLDYAPPQSTVKTKSPLPVVIRVERLAIAPAFDTEKMTYQEKSNTLATYNYHRWRANPADLVTYFLTRDLQATQLFAAVLPPTGKTAFTHSLDGTVDTFLETDEEDGWYASLSLTMILLNRGEPDISRRIVFQKTLSAKVKFESKHPLSVSRAMSQAMTQISEELTSAIYHALK